MCGCIKDRPTTDILDETAAIFCFLAYDVTSYQHQRTLTTVCIQGCKVV